jgi:hypothetical protein
LCFWRPGWWVCACIGGDRLATRAIPLAADFFAAIL